MRLVALLLGVRLLVGALAKAVTSHRTPKETLASNSLRLLTRALLRAALALSTLSGLAVVAFGSGPLGDAAN